jgi:hypothetical protein
MNWTILRVVGVIGLAVIAIVLFAIPRPLKPTPTVSLTAEQMLERLAAALNLSKT